jgi:mRNA interferase MazF
VSICRGDILWVDFSPTRGSEQSGLRPALVVQNDLGNQLAATTIVAAVTSQLPTTRYPFHVWFTAKESGLKDDGVVKLEQLLTVSVLRLRNKAGHLPPARMAEVDEALRQSLGLK